MRETVELVTSVGQKHEPGWQQVAKSIVEPLGPRNVEISPHGLVIEFHFDHLPTGADLARDALRMRGISSSLTIRREYAQQELLAAEFLNLIVKAEVNSERGTLKYQTLPLCSYCGFQETHWDLEGLRIREAPEGYQIATVDWHPEVMSAPLAEAIQEADLTGFEFVPIRAEHAEGWYAFRSDHRLPPMQAPPTRLKRSRRTTALCELDHGWARADSEFYYRWEGFRALDLNYSYELFGGIESSSRAMVISNRAYKLFLSLGVQGIVAEPIRFVE